MLIKSIMGQKSPIREKFYLLKEKYAQTGVSEIDKIYLNWAERDLNSAVEFIQDLLKEA